MNIWWSLLLLTLQQTSNAFQWVGQPQKLPLPLGIWNPSTVWFHGPIRVSLPNGISIGSIVFARFTNVSNKQTYKHTDWPRYSVCSSNPYLMQCMQCRLIIQKRPLIFQKFCEHTRKFQTQNISSHTRTWRVRESEVDESERDCLSWLHPDQPRTLHGTSPRLLGHNARQKTGLTADDHWPRAARVTSRLHCNSSVHFTWRGSAV